MTNRFKPYLQSLPSYLMFQIVLKFQAGASFLLPVGYYSSILPGYERPWSLVSTWKTSVLLTYACCLSSVLGVDWFELNKILREEKFNGTLPEGPDLERLSTRITEVVKKSDPGFYQHLVRRMANSTNVSEFKDVNIMDEYALYASSTSTLGPPETSPPNVITDTHSFQTGKSETQSTTTATNGAQCKSCCDCTRKPQTVNTVNTNSPKTDENDQKMMIKQIYSTNISATSSSEEPRRVELTSSGFIVESQIPSGSEFDWHRKKNRAKVLSTREPTGVFRDAFYHTTLEPPGASPNYVTWPAWIYTRTRQKTAPSTSTRTVRTTAELLMRSTTSKTASTLPDESSSSSESSSASSTPKGRLDLSSVPSLSKRYSSLSSSSEESGEHSSNSDSSSSSSRFISTPSSSSSSNTVQASPSSSASSSSSISSSSSS